MRININGQFVELNDSRLSIDELVKQKNLNPERIVIEYNGRILGNENWEETLIRDSDNIMIVSFVGGG